MQVQSSYLSGSGKNVRTMPEFHVHGTITICALRMGAGVIGGELRHGATEILRAEEMNAKSECDRRSGHWAYLRCPMTVFLRP